MQHGDPRLVGRELHQGHAERLRGEAERGRDQPVQPRGAEHEEGRVRQRRSLPRRAHQLQQAAHAKAVVAVHVRHEQAPNGGCVQPGRLHLSCAACAVLSQQEWKLWSICRTSSHNETPGEPSRPERPMPAKAPDAETAFLWWGRQHVDCPELRSVAKLIGLQGGGHSSHDSGCSATPAGSCPRQRRPGMWRRACAARCRRRYAAAWAPPSWCPATSPPGLRHVSACVQPCHISRAASTVCLVQKGKQRCTVGNSVSRQIYAGQWANVPVAAATGSTVWPVAVLPGASAPVCTSMSCACRCGAAAACCSAAHSVPACVSASACF